MNRGGATSTSGRIPKKSTVSDMSEQDFWTRFKIPNDIIIRLSSVEDLRSLSGLSGEVVVFTKEQFAAGLRLRLPSLVKQFLHCTKIPPAFLHLKAIWVLMGSYILDLLYQLDLSLLEFLSVYAVKMIQRGCFSVAAYLPSLAFVTNLLTSSKWATKGLVVVGGPWYGSVEGANSVFALKFTFGVPSNSLLLFSIPLILVRMGADFFSTDEKKRGKLVECFDRAAFGCLSRLY